MGRPTKLTPDCQERICNAIEQGLPYAEACLLAGITYETFHNWRTRGAAAKSGLYFGFIQAVSRAEAKATQVLVDAIRNAAERGSEEVTITQEVDPATNKVLKRTVVTRRQPKDWRAALAMLERRNPESWGRRVVEHEGIPAGGASVMIGTPSLELNLVFDDGDGEESGNVIEGRVIDESDTPALIGADEGNS